MTDESRNTPLPTSLGGASVRINGQALPLIRVSATRIDFQVPWEMAGVTSGTLTVTVGSLVSAAFPVSLATYSPSVYANTSLGNAGNNVGWFWFVERIGSNTIPSDPVYPGELVEMGCSGLGPVTNQPASGDWRSPTLSALTVATPVVKVGGTQVEVMTSQFNPPGIGPPDLFTYGVIFRLPTNLSSGLIPAVLTIGGATSNTVNLFVGFRITTPSLVSISPTSAVAGGPGFTLALTGTNMSSVTSVRWNGNDRPTTLVSATQVTASIPASDIATSGTAQVTVINPVVGGGQSNAIAFTISAPVPTLSALAPASASSGGAGFALTVSGNNYLPKSVVRWNGADRTTTYVSSSQLTAAIGALDIASQGTAVVTVFNPTPGGGTTAPLTFTVTSGVGIPSINAGGVVNGASFATGPVAAGSIASAYGVNLASSVQLAGSLPLPTTLGGASLKFNNSTGAPLFYTSGNQVNLQIPWELDGQTQGSLTATVAGAVSNSQTVAVAPAAPGIFMIGSQQGAIQIANTASFAAPAGSIPGADARPAQRGEYLSVYCTGLGAVTNVPATGAPAGASPLSTSLALPTITIGGVTAPVSFSGLAAGFVGVYQVNVQIPPEVPVGDAVQLVLTASGAKSNTVTVAVK